MNDKTENIFNQTKPLETLVALDVGFSCLLENIKNTNPTLAKSLAIDLEQTSQQIPLHLPEQAHGAIEVLQKWAAVLKSDPTQSTGFQSN